MSKDQSPMGIPLVHLYLGFVGVSRLAWKTSLPLHSVRHVGSPVGASVGNDYGNKEHKKKMEWTRRRNGSTETVRRKAVLKSVSKKAARKKFSNV
jgi:hypothetical protein